MAVIEGPGGSNAGNQGTRLVDEEALSGLVAYSPLAARVVLAELSARLREKDLAIVRHWSDDVGDELLD